MIGLERLRMIQKPIRIRHGERPYDVTFGVPTTEHERLAVRITVRDPEGAARDHFDLGLELMLFEALGRDLEASTALVEAMFLIHAQQIAGDRLLSRVIQPTLPAEADGVDVYLLDPLRYRRGRIALVAPRT